MPLLEIEKLECKYGQKSVLHSENIVFESGKVYFLLGKSGAGKSTFLEALGLMTNTMTEDSQVFYKNNNERINLVNLWKTDDDEISNFRKKYYSFIFQNTNLMSNFTAGENMCFTLMLSNVSFEESKSRVLELMEKVDLPVEVFDKNINNVSGGQRQRIAFVRAFTAPHEVIFCDEPTGNLDEVVARKLMEVFTNQVYEKKKIAIIVSHDIKLATQFADEIYYAKYIEGSDVGQISNIDKYVKRNEKWYDTSNNLINNIGNSLVSKISN